MRDPSPQENTAPPSSAPSPPSPSPPPRRRFGFARRLLGPLLSPVAHYVRRYLQASVQHELRALSADVQATRAQLDVVIQQNERLTATLARLEARTTRFGDALDSLQAERGLKQR